MTGTRLMRPAVDSDHRTLPATRHLRLGAVPDMRPLSADAEVVAARSTGCGVFAKSRWWSELGAWLTEGKAEDGFDDRCRDPGVWAARVRRQSAALGYPVGELASFGAAIGVLAPGVHEGNPASGLRERVHALLRAGSTSVSAAARELGQVVFRFVTSADLGAHEGCADGMLRRASVRLGHVAALHKLLRLATACQLAAPDLDDDASAQAWASSVSEALAAAARIAHTQLADLPSAVAAGAALASAAESIRALVPLFDTPKTKRPRSARRAAATTRRGTPR